MSSNEVQRLTGMVKWFNNKSGFGFITVYSDGDFKGKDIFAHYSSIRVTNSQYKYLVQGEYVDFNLSRSDNEKHEYHAMDITGVMNGPILCETRRQAISMQSDEKRDAKSRRPRATRDEGSEEQVAEASVEASAEASA
jgi:cold shock CspA family protein